MLFRVLFAWMIFATGTHAAEPQQAAAEAKEASKLIDKATEKLHDYLLALEAMDRYSYMYTGQLAQVLEKTQEFSGVFPFTGFRAVDLRLGPKNAKRRFWATTTMSVHGVYRPNSVGYDEVLIGDERWYTRGNQRMRNYLPKEGSTFKYHCPVIDPRASVFCLAAGVISGSSLDRDGWPFVDARNIVDVKEDAEGIWIVFSCGMRSNSWAHCYFKKSQAYRPTIMAITEADEGLDPEFANARHVNRTRWQLTDWGDWLPVACENVNYSRGTKLLHRSVIYLTYEIVWIPFEQLEHSIFSKEDLNSSAAAILLQMEDWLGRASKVKPVAEMH